MSCNTLRKSAILASLVLLSMAANVANAQSFAQANVVGHLTEPNLQTPVAVRGWNDSCSLICYSSSERELPLFSRMRVDGAMTVWGSRNFYLKEPMLVSDMEVIDDMVFFCGHDAGGARLGCFPIGSMGSGSVPVVYAKLDSPSLATLRRMAVYRLDEMIRVVMIGAIAGESECRVVVDAQWDGSGWVDVQCWESQPYVGASIDRDYFDDVVCTEDFVCIVGRTKLRTFSSIIPYNPCLRRYKKGQLYSGMMNNIYYFSTYFAPHQHHLQPILATSIKENVVFLGTQYFDSGNGKYVYLTFDLNNDGLIAAQYIDYPDPTYAYGFTYASTLSKAVASMYLYHAPQNDRTDYLLLLDPLATANYDAEYRYGDHVRQLISPCITEGHYLISVSPATQNYFTQDLDPSRVPACSEVEKTRVYQNYIGMLYDNTHNDATGGGISTWILESEPFNKLYTTICDNHRIHQGGGGETPGLPSWPARPTSNEEEE